MQLTKIQLWNLIIIVFASLHVLIYILVLQLIFQRSGRNEDTTSIEEVLSPFA